MCVCVSVSYDLFSIRVFVLVYDWLTSLPRVPLRLTNGPKQIEGKLWPLYRKNPALGNKLILYASQIWLEAADAKLIEKDEEVRVYWRTPRCRAR